MSCPERAVEIREYESEPLPERFVSVNLKPQTYRRAYAQKQNVTARRINYFIPSAALSVFLRGNGFFDFAEKFVSEHATNRNTYNRRRDFRHHSETYAKRADKQIVKSASLFPPS